MQLNQGAGPFAGQWHAFAFNLDQLRNGDFPHSGSVTVDPGQGTSYTVRFETGTAKTVGFFPLGWAADIAGWVVQVFQTHQIGGFPIPHQPIPPTVSTPGVGVAGQQRWASGFGNPGYWSSISAPTTTWTTASTTASIPIPIHVSRTVTPGCPKAPPTAGPCSSTSSPGQPSRSRHLPVLEPDPHRPAQPHPSTGLRAGRMRRRCVRRGRHHAPPDLPGRVSDLRPPGRVLRPEHHRLAFADCNSGDVSSQNDCGSTWNTRGGSEKGPITQPYGERGAYYTEPGVSMYEDPDPQGSPIPPLYPLCAEYVGTQGVYVCGRPATSGAPTVALRTQSLPATPAPPPPAHRRAGAPVLALGIATGIR